MKLVIFALTVISSGLFIAAQAKEQKTQAQQAQKKEIYTCPMHPEVEQNHPGDCPKCGMHLEKKKSAESKEKK